MDKIQDILHFWFEGLNDTVQIDKNAPVVKKWFIKNTQFDQDIKNKFEKTLIEAKQGQHRDWEQNASGRLALVILFDQFSRNIYRASPGAFETDSRALQLTLKSIDNKKDQEFELIERLFLYMPLMHAEDLNIQKTSVEKFTQLTQESKTKSPPNTSYYMSTLDYAQRHCQIIERFSRFPHRNEVLSRESTKEELIFLAQPGSRFWFSPKDFNNRWQNRNDNDGEDDEGEIFFHKGKIPEEVAEENKRNNPQNPADHVINQKF